jgi:aminoglycoside N3'-acetyltransferase
LIHKLKHQSSNKEEITKADLIKDLRGIGVKNGDHIGLGISFKSVGQVKGGVEAFIDALIEAVGPEGTIMMNTYTKVFYTTEVRLGWTNYVFDPKSTKAWTGIIPETFRQHKNSIRSRHPVNSVAAVGKFAKYLTDGHDENASAYLPYSRLSNINGKYLAIGIGDRLVGMRHQAQSAAGLLRAVPLRRAVKYRINDGEIKTFVLRDRGGCVERLPELVSHLRQNGFVTDGKIAMADVVLVPTKEALEVMTDLLKNNPEINLCDKALCLWCRELERRLDLYKNIENPRYFQKYALVIELIKLMNWLRERDSSIVVRINNFFKKHI